MSFSEKDLGRAFRIALEKQKYILIDQPNRKVYETSFRVYLNKRIPTYSKKFRQFWHERDLDTKDLPPPQPEIDMILADDFDVMRAVEIKVIKETKRGVRPSYYIGLGQALAYISFGFPQVALWLCYDGNNLDDKKIYEYNDAFSKIRMGSPIVDFLDVTYFKVSGKKDRLRLETGLYYQNKRWWEPGIGIPRNEIHSIKWVSVNPFLRPWHSLNGELREIIPKVRKRVETIYKFFEVQRKIWDKQKS